MQIDVSQRLAYTDVCIESAEFEARSNTKDSRCSFSGKRYHIQITSSRCEVKNLGFDQHRETASDAPSCRWSLQFTDAFYSNPDCKTQCENLPYSGQYPRNGKKGWVGCLVIAHMGAKENELLWYYSSHEP